MTKDTEALREAAKVLRKRCDRVKFGQVGFYGSEAASFDSKVAYMLDALATPDTIGSHFGNGGGFDPVAGGEALREALEWYRDQLCEGFCEGFTPRICKAAMEENPTGGDCSGCRAVIALAALKGPAA